MLRSGSKNGLIYGLLFLSFVITYFLGYHVSRTSSIELVYLFSIQFLIYLIIIYLKPDDALLSRVIFGAVGLRLILLWAFPQLSDDIYRFVWDGRLLNSGLHPFAELPSYYMQPGQGVEGLNEKLYSLLNSPNYFTIYPPFAQFVFWLSTSITDSIVGAAVVIRVLIILAEVGTIFLSIQLLKKYNLPKCNVLLYALNPLVILELTGNLHFEAFMIFFLLLTVYCLLTFSIVKASFFMAASIATKLIPLILLTIFLRKLEKKSLLNFYIFTSIFLLLFFLPLFNYDLIEGMGSSLGLYFQKFEFNASVYYLIREIGFFVKGYNIIGSAGKYLALASFISIMTISLWKFKKANQWYVMMWVLTIYFLLATTVHPWYISTLVAISIFTPFRYVIVWSFMIFLSYLGYTSYGFEENISVVIVEYTSIILLIGYELYIYSTNKESRLANLL